MPEIETKIKPVYQQLMDLAGLDEEGLFELLKTDLHSKLEAIIKGELEQKQLIGGISLEIAPSGKRICVLYPTRYIDSMFGRGETFDEQSERHFLSARFHNYLVRKAREESRAYSLEEAPIGTPAEFSRPSFYGMRLKDRK